MRARTLVRVSARVGAIPIATLMVGCWKDDYAVIPPDVLRFQPTAAGAPEGWLVAPLEVALECPDGENARLYVLYPESVAEDDAPTPMAAAVLYPSGAFDFVYAPEPGDPLAGSHFADPDRLSREWAIRQIFWTLGMVPVEFGDNIRIDRVSRDHHVRLRLGEDVPQRPAQSAPRTGG